MRCLGLAARLRVVGAGPSPLPVVRSGRIANDLGATSTVRSAAQDQRRLEYLMNAADLQRSPCKTQRGRRGANGAHRWMATTRTEHSRTAQEGSQRCLPRARKFTGHYKGCVRNKQTPSLRWFGKSRYNTPGKNRSLTSSALSDRMWRPVPFNGPISCRERTRGIYRLQGVAAGYGACVRPQGAEKRGHSQWCSARHLRQRNKYIFTVLRQPRQYGMML